MTTALPMLAAVIIAYVFPKDGVIDPAAIAADQLTHVNYAFANVADGRVVEGFKNDAENYRVLAGLRIAPRTSRTSPPSWPSCAARSTRSAHRAAAVTC